MTRTLTAILIGIAITTLPAAALAQDAGVAAPTPGEPGEAQQPQDAQRPEDAQQAPYWEQQQPGGEQPAGGLPSPTSSRETVCDDRRDDDGDGLADCADADCFEAAICHAGGGEERTEAACSDFVDNDGDQMVDCDDQECQVEGMRACAGSWRGQGQQSGATGEEPFEELPELAEGQTIEDLVGAGGDENGERTDEVCSDGIDNDFDGRTDCADFGCRFDPQVTVCHGTPGMRFSVVVGAGANMNWGYDQSTTPETIVERPFAGFTLLQLRALGPIPFIENSFFLINIQAEESIRLTFLTFNVAFTEQGHYLSLNSGSGSLSTGLITSRGRSPLLEPARYLYNVFEQGNGGALEVGGPIDDRGILRFRIFAAAGTGLATGNVGGVRIDDTATTGNFTWTAGAQMQVNIVGYFDRFDTPFLYTAVPATLAVLAGAKYDQRATERFVAYNAFAHFAIWHISMRAETFGRFVFDDPTTIPIQQSWNYTLGFLIVPRLIFMAADVGGLNWIQPWSSDVDSAGVRRRGLLDEFEWRVAIHWFFWRSTGILAARYREHYQSEDPSVNRYEVEREIRLEARFRF